MKSSLSLNVLVLAAIYELAKLLPERAKLIKNNNYLYCLLYKINIVTDF